MGWLIRSIQRWWSSVQESNTSLANGPSLAVTPPVLLEFCQNVIHENLLQQFDRSYLDKMLGDPVNGEVIFCNVDVSVLNEKNTMLIVRLDNAEEVCCQLRHFESVGSLKSYWYGDQVSDRRQRFPSAAEVEIDPVNRISLVRYGDIVLGEIRVNEQFYRLDYLGAGQHVLLKVNDAAMARKCEPLHDDGSAQSPCTEQCAEPFANSTLRVLMLSTPEAREGFTMRPADYPSLEDIMRDQLWNADRQLQDSGVQIRYEFAGYLETSISERDITPGELLRKIRTTEDPEQRPIQMARDNVKAQLVVMAIIDPSVLGKSYSTARKQTAYALWQIAGDFLSMAHQLGHLMGLEHAWQLGNPEFEPPYMHGYIMDDGSAGTIMTRSVDNMPVLPLFVYSDPTKEWEGKPLGTVEHHDAVRRLNERRSEVEKFYD